MRKSKFYYYDKNICKEVSLLCKNRREFYIKYPAAYDAAVKNNWIDQFLPLSKKPANYWTYETCKSEALKYKTKKEFKEKCESAYKVILKNKWENELFSHLETIGNLKLRLIYAQEFPDFSVYIGLTGNIKNRSKNHVTIKKETVFKYMEQTNQKPYLKILTDYLPLDESILKEKEWVENYKKNNWKILNISKTGGIGKILTKWTIDTIKNESIKYKTKSEFKKNSYNAYCSMYKLKCQNEVCCHMNKPYKSVSQFTLNGEFIQQYETTGDAHQKTGILQSNISSCCNGKYKTSGGYIWKYS
jgi:hypothetical protein